MIKVPEIKLPPDCDWEARSAALAQAPALNLGQAWRQTPEKNFRPGLVRVGWGDGALLVLAELADETVFTRATADHQRLWELGDVLEIFLRDPRRADYLEFHLSPGGHRLQLHFPDDRAIGRVRNGAGKLEDLVVTEPLFDFSTRSVADGWQVWTQIPLPSLRSAGSMPLLVSFSRYDHDDAGIPPVLSSTSAHPELNFHRQQEWLALTPDHASVAMASR